MPTFEYIALDAQGRSTKGSVTAESSAAARRMLRGRQLHATSINAVSSLAQAGGIELSRLFKGRRRRGILEFTRQLQTMIGAEVQLTEALGILIAQTDDKRFAQVLQNIRDAVVSGESFADGLREYPGWFDSIYVSMIRVGEVTGNLHRSLELLSAYIGKRQKLEARVKSALAYPIFLAAMSVVVIIVLMTFIVPRITNMLVQSGRPLPGITVALMGVSHFLLNYGWIVLLGLIAGIGMLRRSLRTRTGRMAFDRLLLKMPVIGSFLKQSVVARFATTLAALIRSGMPMADALQVVADVTGNSILAQAIRNARERIIAGADIATPLRESHVVGPAVAHMISVGERTGELESMLLNIAESLEENTDLVAQRISSLIEPVIIVVMAAVVSIIMLGTLLPILRISDVAGM
ncbi:MAG: type II secretion system F family protein [Sedimentisphaerales bacterium]|nr:type II secretion system F family protein [Sedimentisphaerales bacterium]